ncbi:hypothetical protein AUC31_07920 [Planococcus rifietoensis]|uniref:Uncharacterized protein n=1 Tax=Planococcus rifietoensis TaxID=200991 RepID=A0A0U2Z7I1_9BACL|nr:hypothetical protein AUC31_07920 [Planococcus rifietoensis]
MQEADPKQNGDSKSDDKSPRNIQIPNPRSEFPASRKLLKEADLAKQPTNNEMSQPICVKGEPKHQDRRSSWLGARGQPKAGRRLHK